MRSAWCASLLLALVCLVDAEQLPVIVFSARDGLPAATASRIVTDSRGFVWIPSSDGLARFDGNGFRVFTQADGLPASGASDIFERRNGTYWIAAGDRICLFDPRPHGTRFQCEAPKLGVIRRLLEDERGLWCGTETGLWRRAIIGGTSREFVRVFEPPSPKHSIQVSGLLRDTRGDVWAATRSGLYRVRLNGRVDRWTFKQGLAPDAPTMVAETPGAIWVGTHRALIRFRIDPHTGEARILNRYDRSLGLPSDYAFDVHFWNGEIWAATFQGLARQLPSGRWQAVALGDASLHSLPLEALATDALGNLWVGTDGSGAARVSGSGLTGFTERDGLAVRKVWAIFEDRKGDLMAVTKDEDHYLLNRFDGHRFHPIQPNIPLGTRFGWSWSQIVITARSGGWWLATGSGLLRYQDQLQEPPARLGSREGLREGNIFRVYEDSRGAIWASLVAIGNNGLYRRDPGSGRFEAFDESNGLPSLHVEGNWPSVFAEDWEGQIWIGMLEGGLVRFRSGKFQQFPPSSGAPDQGVNALLIDRQGRLWVGSRRRGLLRVDDPSAASPSFSAYTRNTHGLASDNILALAEDRAGRIYACGSAVDRIDPATGRVRRFTTADGLLPGEFRVATRDRHGALWFGGDQGLSRLIPQEDRAGPPTVLVYSILVNGERWPISDLGDTQPPALSLSSSERQVQVDFGGFRDDLLYQTRLSGVDQDWTSPSRSRSVHYVSLGPDSYELLIRAAAPEGTVSSRPARVRFRIAAPVWQRWWFLLAATGALAGLAYGAHRLVLQRRLAVESTRVRIATDLHDDIGASLARISVLSEVLKSRASGQPESLPLINQIATSARDVVDGLNDVIWSIDPRQDSLSEAIARIRHFASDVLEGRSIEWSFETPPEAARLNLSLEQRRHLLLIFKEAIHNMVRHSSCRRAEFRIGVEDGDLHARIWDDGTGIPAERRGGRGLENMHLRAAQLGGRLEVVSIPGGGTELLLQFPIR